MTLKLQDNKITAAVMMMAAVTAALLGTGPITAFAQTVESEVLSSSGDALAGQVLSELLLDNDAAQTSATPETNSLDDADTATVT